MNLIMTFEELLIVFKRRQTNQELSRINSRPRRVWKPVLDQELFGHILGKITLSKLVLESSIGGILNRSFN